MGGPYRPEAAHLRQFPFVRAYMERLHLLRLKAGFSQAQVAQLLGTSQTMYARYERGANELPIRHLVALSRIYQVTTDDLLGLEDLPAQKRGETADFG